MSTLSLVVVTHFAVLAAQQPKPKSVVISTTNQGTITADLYGSASRGVVLVAHGGYSFRARWEKQARALAQSGFRVLAFDTRAGEELRRTGKETPCLYDPACMSADVLAAVRYLHQTGAVTVSVVGGSAGGGAVAQASVDCRPAEIERIVLLAPMAIANPEKMKARKLFVTTRDDRNAEGPRLPGIRAQYERAPNPKELLVLDGSAHGQLIFDTPQGEQLLASIVQFLSEH